MAIPALFDEQRTAQAAAFFLHKAEGRMPLLKLMKLLYLAERESYRLYGEPISGDQLVSMPHGPVLSLTLDMMNGWGGEAQGGWNHWVGERSGHELTLRNPGMIRSEQDLLALSDGDMEILHGTWERFGHLASFELIEYTQSDACPEWQDPHDSNTPIPTERLLQAVGYDTQAIQGVLANLAEIEEILAEWRYLKKKPSLVIDERALARMFRAGTAAWKDVPDTWVEELRGNTVESPPQ